MTLNEDYGPTKPALYAKLSSIYAKIRARFNDKSNIRTEIEEELEMQDLLEAYQNLACELLCDKLEPRRRAKFTAEAKETLNKKVFETHEKLTRVIFSLDYILPCGKALRDCTGREVGQYGSMFFRIARAVGPDNKVGDLFKTDEQLREFLV